MFILSVFEKIVNSSRLYKFLIMCILVNILSILVHLGRKTPIKNSHHNENISCNTTGSGKIE